MIKWLRIDLDMPREEYQDRADTHEWRVWRERERERVTLESYEAARQSSRGKLV